VNSPIALARTHPTEASMSTPTELHINEMRSRVVADADRSLLSVLRDDLDLTGGKYGCGEGRCGACTVVVDGRAVRSCVTRIADCAGTHITTIEGLEKDGKLHPLQEAFLETDALQCGYCTGGMIMSAFALFQQDPNADDRAMIRFLNGNLCRCGTYTRILAAVRKAAQQLKGSAQ
jgi:aerobic-type carbon monoxide dehydrogenase small subunit (CoxS/CutS family)